MFSEQLLHLQHKQHNHIHAYVPFFFLGFLKKVPLFLCYNSNDITMTLEISCLSVSHLAQ